MTPAPASDYEQGVEAAALVAVIRAETEHLPDEARAPMSMWRMRKLLAAWDAAYNAGVGGWAPVVWVQGDAQIDLDIGTGIYTADVDGRTLDGDWDNLNAAVKAVAAYRALRKGS